MRLDKDKLERLRALFDEAAAITSEMTRDAPDHSPEKYSMHELSKSVQIAALKLALVQRKAA